MSEESGRVRMLRYVWRCGIMPHNVPVSRMRNETGVQEGSQDVCIQKLLKTDMIRVCVSGFWVTAKGRRFIGVE